MSGGDDWEPGDLALCIDDHDYDGDKMQITRGCVYTVAALMDAWDDERDNVLGLVLREVSAKPHGDCFEAICFIKVTPPEADEFDRETIALMTGKPVKEPRHA